METGKCYHEISLGYCPFKPSSRHSGQAVDRQGEWTREKGWLVDETGFSYAIGSHGVAEALRLKINAALVVEREKFEQMRLTASLAGKEADLRCRELAAERQRADVKLATTISKEEHELSRLNRDLDASNRQLNQQLTAEHQRAEQAEVLSRGRMQQIVRHQQELIELRQQLLSALAAIREHNESDDAPCCYAIEYNKATLDKHDAEVRQPLVDLLEQANECLKHTEYSLTMVPEIDAALAKVKP